MRRKKKTQEDEKKREKNRNPLFYQGKRRGPPLQGKVTYFEWGGRGGVANGRQGKKPPKEKKKKLTSFAE